MNPPEKLSFENFELDFEQRELRDKDSAVKIEPQVFDLLWFLASRAGQLISKDDIIEHVWGGRIVSDAAISTRVNGARVAVQDNGTEQRIIRTVPKRGFRFLAEVSETDGKPAEQKGAEADGQQRSNRGKPAIAIMPIQAMGGDPELADLAVGMRIEIQNVLIKVSGLFLTAVGSVNAVRDMEALDAAKALGVRYLLQGQLFRSGGRLRLSAQLLDAENNRIILSETFDHTWQDTFAILDETAAKVLETINVALVAGEPARVWHQTLKDIGSLSVFFRGVSNFFQMNKSALAFARAEFQRVARRHPDVSLGYTWIALTHWFDFQRGWSDDKFVSRQNAREYAEKAVTFPNTDGQAHTVLSHVYLLEAEFEKALKAGQKAIANRPSCTNANAFYANVLHYCDQNSDALRHIRAALDRSPFAPGFFKIILVKTLIANGQLDEASVEFARLISSSNDDPSVRLLGCLLAGRQGDATRAAEHAKTLMRLEPLFRLEPHIASEPYKNQDTKHELLASLLACGLPK